jgi:hypothetical protein
MAEGDVDILHPKSGSFVQGLPDAETAEFAT